MRSEHISLDLMLPCNPKIDVDEVRSILDNFDPNKVEPIELIAHGKKYIMGDGQHTACALIARGHSSAYSKILETDDEFIRKAFLMRFYKVRTIDQFVRWYEREKKPQIAARGITTIGDYFVVDPSFRELLSLEHTRNL